MKKTLVLLTFLLMIISEVGCAVPSLPIACSRGILIKILFSLEPVEGNYFVSVETESSEFSFYCHFSIFLSSIGENLIKINNCNYEPLGFTISNNILYIPFDSSNFPKIRVLLTKEGKELLKEEIRPVYKEEKGYGETCYHADPKTFSLK